MLVEFLSTKVLFTHIRTPGRPCISSVSHPDHFFHNLAVRFRMLAQKVQLLCLQTAEAVLVHIAMAYGVLLRMGQVEQALDAGTAVPAGGATVFHLGIIVIVGIRYRFRVQVDTFCCDFAQGKLVAYPLAGQQLAVHRHEHFLLKRQAGTRRQGGQSAFVVQQFRVVLIDIAAVLEEVHRQTAVVCAVHKEVFFYLLVMLRLV